MKVETQSGDYLGKVSDIVIDIRDHYIKQYLVDKMLSDKYLINRNQIIKIENDTIVVEDSIKKIKEEEFSKYLDSGNMEPISMSETK